ncbi:cell division protein FtsQ/DivIB [Stackebrandtia soli]|uniref:cell division protein FtsQ/DivIB n=1 Tax=Stackebrandtia soli TaxID=1892856 RepID=UPI0039EBF358
MAWKLTRPRGRGPARRRRLVVVSIMAAVVVCSLAAIVVYLTPAFSVSRVEVRGVTFVDPNVVREAAAIVPGTSIVSVDAAEVAKRVAALPPVKRVEVTRDWPHAIVIAVTERKPLLSVPDGKRFHLVDAAGVAFRTVDDAAPGTIVASLKDPGRNDPATVAVVVVVAALTEELAEALIKVDGRAANRITLELTDGRTVYWGDASDSERKAEVATALLNRSEKHLDVSAPDVPTVS